MVLCIEGGLGEGERSEWVSSKYHFLFYGPSKQNKKNKNKNKRVSVTGSSWCSHNICWGCATDHNLSFSSRLLLQNAATTGSFSFLADVQLQFSFPSIYLQHKHSSTTMLVLVSHNFTHPFPGKDPTFSTTVCYVLLIFWSLCHFELW